MKLYIVVRSDLSPGAQMAQSVHAFREFVEEHPEIEYDWYKNSNTIVILAANDEQHLMELEQAGKSLGLKISKFREPDMNHQVTSIVFEPGQKTSEFLSTLKLAGSFSGIG